MRNVFLPRSSALLIGLSAAQLAAAAPKLSSSELARLQETAVGDSIDFARLPLGGTREGTVHMKRIDVYAPDTKILVPDGKGYREVPRSDWLHFVVDRAAYGELENPPRIGLSIAPDGADARGVLLSDDGQTFAISGDASAGALKLVVASADKDADGASTDFVCQNDKAGELKRSALLNTLDIDPAAVQAITAGSRSAVVAADTDNEFMQLKFSNNTTNATNYLAQLFVGFNVIYNRDLDLNLTQGTTFLRVSTTPDPYTETGANAVNQLDEVGEVWVANHAAVNRAFVMFLSGKSTDPQLASGIAWVLGNGNYCTQKGTTFAGCDGTCTSGHYSASQVFRFGGATAASDLLVVAHEIGHNFGANHSHCSDASSGAGPQATGTIDQCWKGEAGSGCYAGNTSCPVPTTVNGIAGVTGTLMSYCHIGTANGVAGCTSSQVFATAHRTLLNPRVANNVTLGCFTSGGGGPDQVFKNGFE